MSVRRALEYCGSEVIISSDPLVIGKSGHVILPGVGAFGDGIKELSNRGLIEVLKKIAEAQRPLLGICLGMQLLMDESFEFGYHKGLGFIPGSVVKLPEMNAAGEDNTIPFIGWNGLERSCSWNNTILEGINPGARVFYVHSYMVTTANEQDCVAVSDYAGTPITAVIASGNLYGCQFHPEKSATNGLNILKNFLKL